MCYDHMECLFIPYKVTMRMRTFHCVSKFVLITTIVWGLLCLAAPAALAAPGLPLHAKVLSADPAIGSTITHVPTKVTVTAAESINPDPAGSNLFVYGPSADATATLISQGDAKVPLSSPKQMVVTITPNSGHVDGVYVVMWKTVSADDGDAASGSFTFTVNTKGATTGQQNTSQVPGESTGANGSGIQLWVPIVAALAALLAGLGVGLGLGRRRQAALSSSQLAALRRQVEREGE